MTEANDGGALVTSVESLIAEKAAVAAKEKKLIEDLNSALGKMGYRVVPDKGAPASGGTGAKRGRPAGSGKGAAAKTSAAPSS